MTRHQVSGNSERTPGGADPAAYPRRSRRPPGNRTFSGVHDFRPIEARIHVIRLAAQVAAFAILATQPNNKLGRQPQ